MAKRKISRRPRRRTTSRKKKPKGHLSKLVWGGIGVAFLSFLGFVVYLDIVVREQFEGKRWALPAHVYGHEFDLYAGQKLRMNDLVSELNGLGYRKVGADSRGPGTYAVGDNVVNVTTRPFVFWDGFRPSRNLEVVFSHSKVKAISDKTTDASIAVTKLEPRLLGSISPGDHEDRSLIKLEEVPKYLITALLVTEDRSFPSHYGIDPRGMMRALWVNLSAGKVVQGGSTITQQLIKNFYLTSERTIHRKLVEMIMALLLEAHYSKEEIMETYLNEVYLGQSGNRAIHGFGLASYFYFGRPLNELRISELALLVGIIKGPSYYNPIRNPKRAVQRRNRVLDAVWGHVPSKAAQLSEEKRSPSGVTKTPLKSASLHPAFLDFVRRQLRRDYREDDLNSEGLAIFTTLDPKVQSVAEQALKSRLQEIETRRKMSKGSLQGAVLVVRTDNGEVVSVVGGRSATFAGFNRALDARRPIGSLVKPAVYLAALENPQKYTLATLLIDDPLEVTQPGQPLWRPMNYDKEFHGKVTLLDALTYSYNISTVRLGLALGVSSVSRVLNRLGVQRDLPQYPALFLGSVELAPVEVTQMYQTLANGGFRAPLRTIVSVLSHDQKPLARYPLSIEQTVEATPAYLINFALQAVIRRGTGRGLLRRFPSSLNIAGKTGTTDGLRDSWFAGYTGNYLAVVWVGRDDNKPAGLTGSAGAMQVWADLMARLNVQPLVLGQPDDVDMVRVDLDHGSASGSRCENIVEMPFAKGSVSYRQASCEPVKAGKKVGNWFRKVFGDNQDGD